MSNRHFILQNALSNREGKDPMAKDLIAKLVLSREEVVHLYQGGILSVKIKGKESDASVEISCREAPEQRGARIRFKTVEVE